MFSPGEDTIGRVSWKVCKGNELDNDINNWCHSVCEDGETASEMNIMCVS